MDFRILIFSLASLVPAYDLVKVTLEGFKTEGATDIGHDPTSLEDGICITLSNWMSSVLPAPFNVIGFLRMPRNSVVLSSQPKV